MKQSRMLRVWACLVVSMTAGSAFLAWLAPASTARARWSHEEYESMAQQAVASRTTAARWDAVTLIPQPGAAERRQLAAVAGEPPVHFTIARDGAVRAHATWIEQLPLDEARQVRVALPADASAEIAAAQAAGLQALLVELQRTLHDASASQPLPIHLDQAAAPQVAPRVRAQLLALIGGH